MQYIFLAVLILVAIYVVFWLAVASFMWVVLPAYVIIMPVALLVGIGMAITYALLTLGGSRAWRPRLITPDDVTSGTARLPKLPADNPFGRDWAWPSYLVSQWRLDLTTWTSGVLRILRKGWQRLPARIGYAAIPVYPVWLAVNVGALLGMAVILVLCYTIGVATWLIWLAATGFLRGTDNLIRRMRRASASCPSCYHVTSLPTFPCHSCNRPHRDIRPGRLGGAFRRCGCGAALPTTVLRAAHKVRPHCPRCNAPYRDGAAVLTDIRIPVFGPVSAGKTRLVHAGLVAMRDKAIANGATVDFVDEESKDSYATGAAIIESNGNTSKTAAGQLPTAITVQIKSARRKATLHLFDAAGEFYTSRDENSDLEFLDHAQGLVFVVDPFSMRWVSDQLGGPYSPQVARANPAVDDPEQVYHVTVQRLRDYRIDTKRRNLAIAVVKADLLAGTTPAHELTGDSVRDWLNDAGLDNLVLSAERDFADVRYFLAASVKAHSGMSPAKPFTWLLAKAGIDLAAESTQKEPV